MGSSIVLKLLNVTQYYRNQKNRKWYLPFGYGAEDIELNKISLHIYQGEALALIGEPGSSKTLIGRIMAQDIAPDRGKVVQSASIYYGDIKNKHLLNMSVKSYIEETQCLFNYKTSSHIVDQIIKYAHLDDKSSIQVNKLSHSEYAQLILSVARVCKTEIIILSHILEYLDEAFLNKAKQLSKDYVSNDLSIIFVDDDISKISQVSNYVTWISHGQVRMEGYLNDVLPVFNDHERDRLSIEDEETLKNFDLDWKKSRSRLPEMSYNFKRVERYKHVKVPDFIVKFWTLLVSTLIVLVLLGALVVNNIGKIEIPINESQKKVQNQDTDSFENKLSYGIVLHDEVTLSNHQDIEMPKYSFVTITGESASKYRLIVDDDTYEVGKNKIYYFNPAALYETHKFSTLAPYMKSNYSKYVDYFNTQLHKPHKQVKKTLVPEKDQRFVVPITQQPIKMLFNDEDKLTGFVFPIVDKSKLERKFNIKGNVWISKLSNGYLIADMKNSKWIYIEL